LVVPYTSGIYGGSTPTMLTTGAPQGNNGVGNQYVATSTISTVGWGSGTTTLNAGDVFTIAGVYAVHDETKANLGYLKQFVVVTQVSDTAGAIANLVISPAIISGGAYQNVSALPATSAAITMAIPNSSTTTGVVVAQNLAYHRDAFIFATADLILPGSINKEEFAEREEFEGISLRVVRRFDINNDFMPCRIDVLYGYTPALIEIGGRTISVVS
jgi:P22 coat protein - gene protein 5